EAARGAEDDLLAHLVLAEGEVAGARVADEVDALGRQLDAGAVGHPGVLADLRADPQAADLEDLVAQRVGAAVVLPLDELAGGPALEPPRLVVDAVAAQVPLADEADDRPS